MEFFTEQTGYEKTILSDLQGAWEVLRRSVAESGGFKGWDRIIFHIDEAMSWETVRNIDRMPGLLLLIRNLCNQFHAPKEIKENLEDVAEILDEVNLMLSDGEIL